MIPLSLYRYLCLAGTLIQKLGFLPDKRAALPGKAAGFRLVRKIQANEYSGFTVGLYRDSTGRRAVAKVWQGILPNMRYLALLREIQIYKEITVAQNLLTKSSFKKRLPVRFPNYMTDRKTRSQHILLLEYVSGKTLSGDKPEGQLTAYNAAKGHLRSLSTVFCQAGRKKQVYFRGPIYYLFTYPFILALALIKNISLKKKLLGGVKVFFRGLPDLFRTSDYLFVHGDLHMDNILKNGREFYLIDPEQGMYTYTLYETVTTLASTRLDPLLRQKLEAKVPKDNLFGALAVFCATYNLCGHSSPESLAEQVRLFDLAKISAL